MTFEVTVHEQTTRVVEIQAADSQAAIAAVANGQGTTKSTVVRSVQYLPVEQPAQ
jgi:hypothetical protein